jgi:hypothetical protein
MTGLRRAAADYLALRRALGYKLRDYPWLLSGLVSYLEDAGRPRLPRSWRSRGRWPPRPQDPGRATGASD